MGVEGADNLANYIRRVEEPTARVAPRIADRVGERMVYWTKANTPVEGFIKHIDQPYHLRDMIFQKKVRVYQELGKKAYETGAETNIEYAPYVERGTGLWGPYHQTYEIRPKNPNGWLSWITEKGFVRQDGTFVPPGTRVFAKKVLHPGIKPAWMFATGEIMIETEWEEIAHEEMDVWAREVEAL